MTTPRTSPLLVTCLCAEWCGACREYRALFEQASVEFGAACRFSWVDIEDEAELVGSVDVDNFPTLLIAGADGPFFFGTVTPHAQTLSRLVSSALAGELKPAAIEADVLALAGRLAHRPT